MLTSSSMSDIISIISKELPYTVTRHITVPTITCDTHGYCESLSSYEDIKYEIENMKENRNVKLIGILFCPPSSPLGKAEIVDLLPLYDCRSKNYIDFFCAGYIPALHAQHGIDKGHVSVGEYLNWMFSNAVYDELIEELEKITTWKYSGESTLILLCASKDERGKVDLHFDMTLICNLEQMIRDKSFTSVRAFF